MNRNELFNFLSKPFPLLDDAKSKWFLVLFCGVFSTFFILFYNPFNIQELQYETALGRLLSIWNAGILGAIILAFTQFILRPGLKLSAFKVGQFSLWVLFEFICLCLGIYIVFGENEQPFVKEIIPIIKYTISVAILPYSLACLLIAVKKLSNTSQQEKPKKTTSSDQHFFKDENGKIMLAIKPSQILFLKSENNYTAIHYLRNDKVERKLIRTNLKKLEGELEYPHLLRIHRSYMINLDKIESVQRKKGSFHVELNQLPDTLLKVSESYKESFEERFKN